MVAEPVYVDPSGAKAKERLLVWYPVSLVRFGCREDFHLVDCILPRISGVDYHWLVLIVRAGDDVAVRTAPPVEAPVLKHPGCSPQDLMTAVEADDARAEKARKLGWAYYFKEIKSMLCLDEEPLTWTPAYALAEIRRRDAKFYFLVSGRRIRSLNHQRLIRLLGVDDFLSIAGARGMVEG